MAVVILTPQFPFSLENEEEHMYFIKDHFCFKIKGFYATHFQSIQIVGHINSCECLICTSNEIVIPIEQKSLLIEYVMLSRINGLNIFHSTDQLLLT